jgi:hypothetical protein
VPWNLLNIAMASTNVPFWQFTIASAIGECARGPPPRARTTFWQPCTGSAAAPPRVLHAGGRTRRRLSTRLMYRRLQRWADRPHIHA